VTEARYWQLLLSHSIDTSPEISVPCIQELGPWFLPAKSNLQCCQVYRFPVFCMFNLPFLVVFLLLCWL